MFVCFSVVFNRYQANLCNLFQDCVECLVVNTKEICLSARNCTGTTENVSIELIDAVDDTMYEINGTYTYT